MVSKDKNFWLSLKKPFFCLAPMYDVTDEPFRLMFAKYGKPDVLFTEFVSADGLCSKGFDKLRHHLLFSKEEKPIVLQIFGSNPKTIEKAAALGRKLGFDGIDINMGCPDRAVEKSGAGAALIKNPKLAQNIIKAAQIGAGGLPVSVKTRIGYLKNEISFWLPALLEAKPIVVTIHARTRKEMSLVPARWDVVKMAVDIRNQVGSFSLIVGNGDISSYEDGLQKAKESGVDGIMVGRGAFGKPWFFAPLSERIKFEGVGIAAIRNRLKIMLEHTELFEKKLIKEKNFAVMKKHFKAYVAGFDGAKDLRVRLMEAENFQEIENIVNDFLKSYK
jgi:nifR3 family TIM-barrel protein